VTKNAFRSGELTAISLIYSRSRKALWAIAETGDFDGDGKSDILWRETSAGTVEIWFMNGVVVSAPIAIGYVSPDWVIQGANAE
jgi:hypothetical protein